MSVLREIVAFLCGFISLRLCCAQLPFLGSCPQVKAMSDFNPSMFLGKWYEAEKYLAVFQLGGKCVTADYTDKGNGLIGVDNKQINSWTGKTAEIKGEARKVSSSTKEGKLTVRFPSLPIDFPAPYWVVDTDYDSYAVVWGCNDFGIFHTRNAWILTRERNPPASVLEKADSVLTKNKISKSYFLRTDQKNCPRDK